VLELNGAVDFSLDYRLDGQCVFERVLQVLTGFDVSATAAVGMLSA
jgi:hypothetical protein